MSSPAIAPAAAGAGAVASTTASLSSIMSLRDAALTDYVIEHLPRDTYTSVTVSSRDRYTFNGMTAPKPIRVINLQVNTAVVVSAFFRAIFAGFGLVEGDAFEGRLNTTELERELLNSLCDVPTISTEIQKAYERCTNVILYIAQDGSSLEMEIKRNDVVEGAYKIAQVLKSATPHILYAIAHFKK